MKLLHTSDWHLGRGENERSLIGDQRHFIEEICEIAEREAVDAVLIAGDVYDRAVAPAEAIQLYNEAMTRLCLDRKKQVIVIAGNHDHADRLAGCRELLERSGLHVLGAIEREPRKVSFDDAEIFLFPWFTEEKVKALYPERASEVHSLTDACRIVCDAARDAFSEGKQHIALCHAFVANSVTSGSDKSAELAAVGTAMQIDADVFHDFDYVALGHIHGPQDISSHMRYSGTPMAYSFGREEEQEKSVTVIDTVSMEKTVIALHPLHKRTTLEASYEELLKADYPAEIREGYVRLRANDTYVGYERASRLQELYPLCMEIQGKSFEGDAAGSRMTMEEFERLESDPVAIFKSFCLEVLKEEPDEHRLALFAKCLESEGCE